MAAIDQNQSRLHLECPQLSGGHTESYYKGHTTKVSTLPGFGQWFHSFNRLNHFKPPSLVSADQSDPLRPLRKDHPPNCPCQWTRHPSNSSGQQSAASRSQSSRNHPQKTSHPRGQRPEDPPQQQGLWQKIVWTSQIYGRYERLHAGGRVTEDFLVIYYDLSFESFVIYIYIYIHI